MRILGFSKKWSKLEEPEFTTFRFPRKDKDWQVGELVQIVFKPRQKGGGERLGVAKIINKQLRAMARHGNKLPYPIVSNAEAEKDGFSSIANRQAYFVMWEFLWDYYGGKRLLEEPMNKLTLRWFSP